MNYQVLEVQRQILVQLLPFSVHSLIKLIIKRFNINYIQQMSSKNISQNAIISPEIQPQVLKTKQQPFITTNEEGREDPLVQNITNLITNSVVINKKLHRQILEKEYLMKAQSNEASLKMNSLLRQMQDLHHKTQNFYQETIRQNQKARFLIEQLIKPFQEELRHKVDQTTLTLKMKLMLTEYDNLGHKISYDNEGKAKSEGPSPALQFIKNDLLPIFATLQSRINILEAKGEQQQKLIEESLLKQTQMQEKISSAYMQIEQIKKANSNHKQKQQSLKLEIAANYKKLNDSLVRQNQELTDKIQQVKKETNQLKTKLQKANFSSRVNTDKVQRFNQEKYFQQVKQIMNESISEVRKQLQQLKIEADKHSEQLIGKKMIQVQQRQQKINTLLEDIKKMKESLAQFSTKVQEEALNNINKAIISKVHKLQGDSKNYQSLFKTNDQRMKIQQRELITMKNLLAQKANFSDFIRLIQMKADKEDYRYLKDLIHSQNGTGSFTDLKQSDLQQLPSNIQQNSYNSFKLRNKKILGGQRKMHAGSPSPILNSNEKDDSVKKYMLGLESPPKRRGSKDKPKLLFVTQSENRKWVIAKKNDSQGGQLEN